MLNRNTLIVLGILIVLLAGLILAYFLVLKPAASDNAESREQTKDAIETDLFSIKLIDGWVEAQPVYGSAATAINNNELINNLDAQKIGFKSYYSVLQDIYSEKTEKDYLDKIKASLKEGFVGVIISDGEAKDIDNRKLYFIESEFNQQNIDFKVLLAITIKDKDAWIISFNTLKENWEEYKNSFYQVAENFKIK